MFAFALPEDRRRDDGAVGRGDRAAQPEDEQLTCDDDEREPRVDAVDLDERDEYACDEQLVRGRVEERAERRRLLPAAREPPVDEVGDRRDREHDGSRAVYAHSSSGPRSTSHITTGVSSTRR